MKKFISLFCAVIIAMAASLPVYASGVDNNASTAKNKTDLQIWQEDKQEVQNELNRRLALHKNEIFHETFDYTTSNGNTITVDFGTAREGVSTNASGSGSTPIDGPGNFYTWFEYSNFFLGTGKIRAQVDYTVTEIVNGAPSLKARSCSLTATPPQGCRKDDQDFSITVDTFILVRAEGYITFINENSHTAINLYPDIQVVGDNSPPNTLDWYWSC